jgi:hypothetical protein
MILNCKRPVLIVEGAGDIRAVPRLIRETLHKHSIFDLNPAPRPKSNVEIKKLMRAGEFERYVEYGHATTVIPFCLLSIAKTSVPLIFARDLLLVSGRCASRRRSGSFSFGPNSRVCFSTASTRSRLASGNIGGCQIALP